MIQSKTLTKSKWQFGIQMGRIYTRNVFKDFEEKIFHSTAYKIEDNTVAGTNCYLVCHTNKTSKISWGQHKFKVRADKENDEFSCECREWEHTGTKKILKLQYSKLLLSSLNLVLVFSAKS